ncbi:Cloroperoxidase [Xylariaceae sp. FL0804]|nr:Cloroperoxidase [Xylariaceae sp. FL0804]
MRAHFLLAALTLGRAYAMGSYHTWAPAGPGDVRAPCPMLNTLANHGFLPHDGKNISLNDTAAALDSALNIPLSISGFLFTDAMTTNPDPNATTFDLDDLSRHDILEHDGSLSRTDHYLGNQAVFNQTIFNQTMGFWTGPVVDVQMAANARAARMMTSMLDDPAFSLSSTGSSFSVGESAAYLLVLGDNDQSRTVPKDRLVWWFQNERLPLQFGWKKPAPFTNEDLSNLSVEIMSLTAYPPPVTGNSAAPKEGAKRRSYVSHAGFINF